MKSRIDSIPQVMSIMRAIAVSVILPALLGGVLSACAYSLMSIDSVHEDAALEREYVELNGNLFRNQGARGDSLYATFINMKTIVNGQIAEEHLRSVSDPRLAEVEETNKLKISLLREDLFDLRGDTVAIPLIAINTVHVMEPDLFGTIRNFLAGVLAAALISLIVYLEIKDTLTQ